MARAKTIDTIALDEALCGRIPVSEFIRDLSMERRIAYVPAAAGFLADAISSLSDAGHKADTTENQLLALTRAGILSEAERFALHAAYLRQKDE